MNSKTKTSSKTRPSGNKTASPKGDRPVKGGLFDPHAHCTAEMGCEVAAAREADRDMSAPERRRQAQVALDLAVQAFVKAALAEGQEPDKIRKTVDELAYDGLYFAKA